MSGQEKMHVSLIRMEDEKSFEDLDAHILAQGYAKQNLKTDNVEGFRAAIFHANKPIKKPKWKSFVSELVADGEDALKNFYNKTESFVLLLADAEHTYAVTGGNGYFAVQEYMCPDFGIDVFSRITKKEQKNLAATREKSLTGSVLALSQNFRNRFNLFENDSFGKIYQEVKANLDKDVLVNKLGFSDEDIKKEHLCIAKSSFRINKPVSLQELIKLINGCKDILENMPAVAINQVEKLSKKKNQSLINHLEDVLHEQLWQRYQDSDGNETVDFDLCPAEVEDYLTSSGYVVQKFSTKKKKRSLYNIFDDEYVFPVLQSIDTLFEKIRSTESAPGNKDDFIKLINGIYISSLDDDGNFVTSGGLYSHLLGDVPGPDNKRYFYVEKVWYLIKDDFIKNLNSSCKHFIQKSQYSGLNKAWNYPSLSEGDYNESYIGEDCTIVLDRVITEGIELCDILKWDDNTVYLIHVKAKFGNTMRDLCSQVSIASKRIIDDESTGWKFIEKVYDNMKQKKGSAEGYFNKVGKQSDIYPKDNFCNLFKNKRITFVLAVLDANTNERSIEEIEKFRSNIAKYSLQELAKKMAGSATYLGIAQISRENTSNAGIAQAA